MSTLSLNYEFKPLDAGKNFSDKNLLDADRVPIP
jgi:hypothetical protein